MTPAEVTTKFRQYIDEPDQTFVSDADVETYLDDGYREFRNIVCDINPMIYNVSQGITLADVDSLDLTTSTPKFLGEHADASAGSLVRINSFNRVDATGRILGRFQGVSNVRALQVMPSSYYLKGTVLMFSRKLTGSYSLEYVPAVNITWTGGGASAFIDDLSPFHDLIPLLAYRQYAIVDGAENGPIIRQTEIRLRRFMEYLQDRAHDGCDYVQNIPWYGL